MPGTRDETWSPAMARRSAGDVRSVVGATLKAGSRIATDARFRLVAAKPGRDAAAHTKDRDLAGHEDFLTNRDGRARLLTNAVWHS
jgi:hypothetical protein